MSATPAPDDAVGTIERFLEHRGVAPENVDVTVETDDDGEPVRYLLDLHRDAPREEVVAFYRARRVNVVYSDGTNVWVYADHVAALGDETEA